MMPFFFKAGILIMIWYLKT